MIGKDGEVGGCRSIVSFFGRLFQALVGHHLVLNGNQHVLEIGGFLPVVEQTQVLHVPVGLVYAGQIDFIMEFERGWLLRILRATLDSQTVDSAVEVGLTGGTGTL